MVALVDAVDFDWLSQWKWTCDQQGYARRMTSGVGGVKRNVVFMHRQIMDAPDGMDVDHKNHNRLDNRRANLRVCTRSQNLGNKRKLSDGFKGVHPSGKRWVAMLRKSVIGTFNSPEEAARAYDKAAREHYGEYAHTNF
jgi:hypothetical protein